MDDVSLGRANDMSLGGTDDMSPDEDNEAVDPFSSDNAPMMNFIMQARIYDVLMSILTVKDESKARDLLALHAEGNLLMPPPAFTGEFLFTTLNEGEQPKL